MQISDIPVWPEATVQFSSANLVKYRMPAGADIGQIIAFYQSETLKKGWVAEHEPFLRADQALLSLRKDTRSATIIIEQAQPGQVRVMVRVSRRWPASPAQGVACAGDPSA